MRIIGGTWRGRHLTTPRGMATRPTGDRVKESLFNILADKIVGVHVLDLYAGSGALGIEALSRGAASAVFVDLARPALAAIQRNIHQLGLGDRTRVIRWNIRSNLNFLRSIEPSAALIFMDPPYECGDVAATLTDLASSGNLAIGARIVIEHSWREAIPQSIAGLALSDQRRYGKTLVSFMDCML